MARPTVTDTAERLYAALGPMQEGDEAHGWPLLRLCDALTQPLAEVEALAADTDTQAGWGPIFDVDAAPEKALPWLGMLVGARLAPALTVDQQRAVIRSAPGQRRGTVAAIKDAARVWLTGAQQVTVTERVGGDAYAVQVSVYEAQAIDVTQLEASIRAAMPAGLNLTLTVLSGRTVTEFESDFSGQTVTAVETYYSGVTILDVERELP